MRKKYGRVGEQLWLETATAIDENSVSAIAQDTYSDLVNREGFKEAKEYWNWDHFWSVSYQDSCRARIYCGIRDYVEERTEGRRKLRETLLKTSEALGNNAESATAALPTMFTAGTSDKAKHVNGGKGLQCFRCGEYGHRSTDPECRGQLEPKTRKLELNQKSTEEKVEQAQNHVNRSHTV